MRQRFLIILASVGLLVGLVSAPALAVGTARYQVATTTYTVAVLDTYIHTFVVVASPCDGSIAITASTPPDSGYYTTETVTGTQTAGVITFSSTYDGPYSPGFMWSGSFPAGGGALSGDFTGTVTAAPTTMTAFKNHGDYVSSMGGGPDAAHSCIGKPISAGNSTTDANGPSHGADVSAAKRDEHAANHDSGPSGDGPNVSDHSTKTGSHPNGHSNSSHSNSSHSNSSHSNSSHSNHGHHSGQG